MLTLSFDKSKQEYRIWSDTENRYVFECHTIDQVKGFYRGLACKLADNAVDAELEEIHPVN